MRNLKYKKEFFEILTNTHHTTRVLSQAWILILILQVIDTDTRFGVHSVWWLLPIVGGGGGGVRSPQSNHMVSASRGNTNL